jgi:hypothetical protein
LILATKQSCCIVIWFFFMKRWELSF